MAGGNKRIQDGEFREWYFPIAEVLNWVRKFLGDIGYELLPPKPFGSVLPDFHARRKEGETFYEIVGIGAQHVDTAVEVLPKLIAIKSFLGDKADYVLVLPPISEYLLLEFFRQDEGKRYFVINEQRFAVWLANPDEESVWSCVGGSHDKLLSSFVGSVGRLAGGVPLNFLFTNEIARRWEEEE